MQREAKVMRTIEKGWKQYGVNDPWDIVFAKEEPWIPRYASEPCLSVVE